MKMKYKYNDGKGRSYNTREVTFPITDIIVRKKDTGLIYVIRTLGDDQYYITPNDCNARGQTAHWYNDEIKQIFEEVIYETK